MVYSVSVSHLNAVITILTCLQIAYSSSDMIDDAGIIDGGEQVGVTLSTGDECLLTDT